MGDCSMNIKALIHRILGGGWSLNDFIKKGLSVGNDCIICGGTQFGSEPWLIKIDNHVQISTNVSFLTHDGSTWCFRFDDPYKDVIRYGKIHIYDNCFIGARVTILPETTIGPNTIIGAGSVVKGVIEPNSVYAGVPAKRICSLKDYAEKCLKETPDYDIPAYRRNKREEVLKVYYNNEL